MYCIVELDRSISFVANGLAVKLSSAKEVMEAIKELREVLCTLDELAKMEASNGKPA